MLRLLERRLVKFIGVFPVFSGYMIQMKELQFSCEGVSFSNKQSDSCDKFSYCFGEQKYITSRWI